MLSPPQLCGIEIVTLYTADCTILTKVNIVEMVWCRFVVRLQLCFSLVLLRTNSIYLSVYLSIYLSIYLLGIEHCFSCVMENMC